VRIVYIGNYCIFQTWVVAVNMRPLLFSGPIQTEQHQKRCFQLFMIMTGVVSSKQEEQPMIRQTIPKTEALVMDPPRKCTCNDCAGYAPQQPRWGVCALRIIDDGNQVVKRNRKACALFRYYGGG